MQPDFVLKYWMLRVHTVLLHSSSNDKNPSIGCGDGHEKEESNEEGRVG